MKKNGVLPRGLNLKFLILICVIVISYILLFILQNLNYLLFHSIVETIGIIPSIMIFIIVIYVWDYLKENNFLSFIGIAFFFIGIIDFIHVLAYEGMSVFPTFDANLPTQLWIFARYTQVISVLIGSILIKRKKQINGYAVFGVYAVLTSFIFYTIFGSQSFPECFIVGSGLTDFKIMSEYIMVVILIISGAMIYKQKQFFTSKISNLLMISIGLQIASELSFTTFASLYGYSNFLGHFVKVLWILAFFKAVLSTALLSPSRNLYVDLLKSEEALKQKNVELKSKVNELDTNRKSLMNRELQLSEMNEQLETLVGERTREVEEVNEGLKEAKRIAEKARKEAEHASEAKGSFLASMSHEIRTPLNAVIGYNHLISKTELNNQQSHYIEIMDSASSNLLAIVNDILDFSRIEAGKVELLYLKTNLFHVINKIINTITFHVYDKNLHLFVEIDPSLPEWVTIDEGRLSQILLNVMSNAVKFTDKGSVTLRINTVKDHLVFEILDTGIGVESEDLKHLFQQFSQANTGIKRLYGGTGLGLAITKRIIDLMEGTIIFKSEKGIGSLVRVELPLISCDHQYTQTHKDLRAVVLTTNSYYDYFINQLENMGIEVLKVALVEELEEGAVIDYVFVDWYYYDKQPQVLSRLAYTHHEIKGLDIIANGRIREMDIFSERHDDYKMINLPISEERINTYLLDPKDASDHKSKKDMSYHGKRILLVEDNPINQELQKMILTEEGAAVILADNGKAAIEKAKHQFFDLILMDIHMPIMDGYEATREIRKLVNGKIIPIIALTADVQNDVELAVKEAGMDDILMKPIDIKRCHEVISKWLQ